MSDNRHRPHPLGASLIATVLTVLAIGPSGCANDTAQPKSVLVVAIDTLRADRLGCYGDASGATPAIDRFAADGVLFERAYSPSSWTLPAFASLYTSLNPIEHGAGNAFPDYTRLSDEAVTLAEVFSTAGYRTATVINVDFLDAEFGLTQGFDRVDAHRGWANLGSRKAEATTDAALELIDVADERPFFLVVHYFDPHLIYEPPAPYRERFTDERDLDPRQHLFGLGSEILAYHQGERDLDLETVERLARLQRGEIAYTDEHIGRLLAGLSKRGLDDRTIVVLLSDHGEEFYEHGRFEHGHALYDELLHVPLIVRAPGVEPRRVATAVGLVDVARSLCELAGIQSDAAFKGRSLLPHLAGEERPHHPLYADGNIWRTSGGAWREGGFKLIADPGADGSVRVELYDLANDPREQSDLARSDPQRRKRMLADLEWVTRRSRSVSLGGEAAELSEEALQRLRSLGYVE